MITASNVVCKNLTEFSASLSVALYSYKAIILLIKTVKASPITEKTLLCLKCLKETARLNLGDYGFEQTPIIGNKTTTKEFNKSPNFDNRKRN